MISDDHRGRWGPGMIEVAALLVRLSHVVDGIGQNVRKTSWTLTGKACESSPPGRRTYQATPWTQPPLSTSDRPAPSSNTTEFAVAAAKSREPCGSRLTRFSAVGRCDTRGELGVRDLGLR